MRHILYISIFVSLFCSNITAQIAFDSTSNAKIAIGKIEIFGLKKTKTAIITRELTFKVGDSIPLSILRNELELNRLRLMNTDLFGRSAVSITAFSVDSGATVSIVLKERWYLFPIPILELADRNFNVWWDEQNRDWRRLNYGMSLTYNNATGRRDPLVAAVQLGYTPRFSLYYSLPYLDKKQTLGMSVYAFRSYNNEIGYTTRNNYLTFHHEDFRLLRREGLDIGFTYQPKLLGKHSLRLGIYDAKIDTLVTNRLNREYYGEGMTQQHFTWLSYTYTHDFRNIKPYPTKGHYLLFNVYKTDFLPSDNLAVLDISVKWAQYFSLSPKLSFESVAKVKTGLLRQNQPYTAQRAIGYGYDYLRGYEHYVVDGIDYGYWKNSLRYNLYDGMINYGFLRIVPKKLQIWPLKIFATSNLDLGRTNVLNPDPTNTFTNRTLYGGGVGIDVVFNYNMLWQFEYSFNHTGKGHFFMHYKSAF